MKLKLFLAIIFIQNFSVISNDEQTHLLYYNQRPLNKCAVLGYSVTTGALASLIADGLCFMIPPYYCAYFPLNATASLDAITVNLFLNPFIAGAGGIAVGMGIGYGIIGCCKLMRYCAAKKKSTYSQII